MSTKSVTPTESTARHPFRTLLKPTMDQGMKKNTNFPHTKFLGSAPELLLQKRFEAIFTLRQNWCKNTLRDIVRGTKAMVQNASKKNSEQTFSTKRCHIYTANIRHSGTAHYFSDVHFLRAWLLDAGELRPIKKSAGFFTLQTSIVFPYQNPGHSHWKEKIWLLLQLYHPFLRSSLNRHGRRFHAFAPKNSTFSASRLRCKNSRCARDLAPTTTKLGSRIVGRETNSERKPTSTILWFNRLSTDFHPTSAVVFGDPNAVAVLPESPAPRHQLRQVYVVQGNTILSSCSRRKRRWPWNRKPLQEHHKELLQCNALAKHGQWLSQVVHPSRALVSALGSCGQLVASHATFPLGRMRNSSIAARFCLAPCR